MCAPRNDKNRRILVIDDNRSIHDDFRKVLCPGGDRSTALDEATAALFTDTPGEPTGKIGFEIDSAFQGREGLTLVRNSLRAGRPYAMAFVDMLMPPGWDGMETIARIWQEDADLQVVICTAHSEYSWEEMAERLGWTHNLLILKKPFDTIEILQFASALTEKWTLARKNRLRLLTLEQAVQQRTTDVVATRDVTVFSLAKLAESRDPETGRHLERIRAYSQLLAEHLGQDGPYTAEIEDDFLDNLYRSSPLHDIGKVGIPDAILLKPGRLSANEFRIMQRHTAIGADALGDVARYSDAGGFLTMAAEIARHHHERWDGSGYPDGVCEQDIPLPARIVALADVYDALTSVRVYKSAFDPCVSRQMIEEQEGKHFDPETVEAFRACQNDFLTVLHHLNGSHEVEPTETISSGGSTA